MSEDQVNNVSSEEVALATEPVETQVEDISPTHVEDKILEIALNDLNKSYSVVEDAITKMSRTASLRVLLAAISYPLDTKKLSTIKTREEDSEILMHALACIRASSVINNVMAKRYDIEKEAQDNLNKEGVQDGKQEQE